MSQFHVCCCPVSKATPDLITCQVDVPETTYSRQVAMAINTAKKYHPSDQCLSAFPRSRWGTGRQLAAKVAGTPCYKTLNTEEVQDA
jgi:hypothetical protein